VRRPLGSWARPIAALLALTVVLAGSAPVAAAEARGAAPASKPTLLAAANAAVATKALPAGVSAQMAAAPAPSTEHKGFFGTTAGKLALVAMVAGTSYMVYSAFKDNDPVHSVFR
jgi:hypothetical protein